MDQKVRRVVQRGVRAAKKVLAAWEANPDKIDAMARYFQTAERCLLPYASPEQVDASPVAAYYLGHIARIRGNKVLFNRGRSDHPDIDQINSEALIQFEYAEQHFHHVMNWPTDVPNPIKAESMASLARLYTVMDIADGKSRESEILSLFKQAANGGSLEGMLGLATTHLRRGTRPVHFKTAQELLQDISERSKELTPLQATILEAMQKQCDNLVGKLKTALPVAQGEAGYIFLNRSVLPPSDNIFRIFIRSYQYEPDYH